MGYIQKQDDQESVNWKEEKAQFKAKLSAYDTVLKNKNIYIKRLIKELELRHERLKQFHKSYKTMQEIAKRLTVVRDEKDNNLKELSLLNEELSTDLNEVNDVYYDASKKVDSLQEELDHLEEELGEVKDKLNETIDDFNDQQDELDEVQKELEEVKEELEEVKEELEEVKDELEE